jgi:beta-lactamase class A
MHALVERLNGLCDEHEFHTGWYLKNMQTGEEADRNGQVIVPSASTRKIAILATALKQIHEGKLALDQPVVIQEKYQYSNSGVFQHFTPGFTITLRDAMILMIIVSDNTCTGTVADIVGLDAVNELCQSIGMTNTMHRHGIPPANLTRDHALDATNTTTPADVGLLLDVFQQATHDEAAASRLGSTTELSQLGIDILSWQKLRQRLPAMLPGTVKVAHKTGTGARNINDAGIIFASDGSTPLFILTVYTDHLPVEAPSGLPGNYVATNLISQLSRTAWEALRET